MGMQSETIMACNDSEIAGVIERAIRERTRGQVRHLRVELTGESVVVHGSTPTYYLKQLALEAARSALARTRQLIIDIDVT